MTAQPMPYQPDPRLEAFLALKPGMVVKFNRPPAGVGTDDLFVVTALNAKTVAIYPLGGSDRYWRVDPRGVTTVDVKTLLAKAAL